MTANPPRPTGPPLNSLRAFEAAARYNSFVKAADELCVTPGAIAQQVKILENWANDKLFERLTNGIQLTTLGASISKELSTTFDQLGQTVQKLRTTSQANEIRIVTLPSIAQFWLMPMLPKIHQIIPDATISITASETKPNMLRDPFDISLFLEQNDSEEDGIVLLDDEIFPVCSPDYLQEKTRLVESENLTFIRDASWVSDWDTWLAQTDELSVTETKGPIFSLYSLAVEEAIHGGGLLMAHNLLVKNLISSGRLISPFKTRVLTNHKLVMHIPKSSTINQTVNQVASILESSVE